VFGCSYFYIVIYTPVEVVINYQGLGTAVRILAYYKGIRGDLMDDFSFIQPMLPFLARLSPSFIRLTKSQTIIG
jgi:hypothetical protein